MMVRAGPLAVLLLGALAFAPSDAYLRPAPRASRVSVRLMRGWLDWGGGSDGREGPIASWVSIPYTLMYQNAHIHARIQGRIYMKKEHRVRPFPLFSPLLLLNSLRQLTRPTPGSHPNPTQCRWW